MLIKRTLMEKAHHLIMDVAKCCGTQLADTESIRTYIDIICSALKLQQRGRPVIDKFPSLEPSEDVGGITAFQCLETSALTLHSYPETGQIYIDVFSCKEFDTPTAIHYTKTFFRTSTIMWSLPKRM